MSKETGKIKLFNKLIISFIFSVLIFSHTALAQTEYEGTSITDFTIHKVVPKKTPTSQMPVFNPDVKEEKKVEKPSAPVKTVKKVTSTPKKQPPKQASKPAPKKVTKKIAQKKPIETKKPVVNKVKTVKVVPEKAVNENTHGVREIPETKIEGNYPKLDIEEKPYAEFNKDNYAKKLNNYLDNDSLPSDSLKEVESSKINSFDYIVKPSMSLAAVLLIILTLAWFYSKAKGINPNSALFNKFGDGDMNRFKVLATSTLGQGKIIHLVEINGKQLVVGSTNNNINLLTEISPEDMQNLRTKAGLKPEEVDPEEYDPEIYSAKYSELYKEYIDKENKE